MPLCREVSVTRSCLLVPVCYPWMPRECSRLEPPGTPHTRIQHTAMQWKQRHPRWYRTAQSCSLRAHVSSQQNSHRSRTRPCIWLGAHMSGPVPSQRVLARSTGLASTSCALLFHGPAPLEIDFPIAKAPYAAADGHMAPAQASSMRLLGYHPLSRFMLVPFCRPEECR